MIKKAILGALILLFFHILYRGYITPQTIISGHQNQNNQIIGQSFLYEETPTKNYIIIGSSLAFRIPKDSIPEFTNLAFGGESPYQGLELIIKKQAFPKVLFIETNLLFKADKTSFEDVAFNPILYPIRKYVPTFRDGREPLPLLKEFLNKKISNYDIIPVYFNRYSQASQNSIKRYHKKTDKIKAERVEHFRSSTISKRTIEKFDAIEASIKDYLKIMEEHGTLVVFFEMPTGVEGCSPASKIRRQFMKERFPADEYIYLDSPKYDKYETSDGIHLALDEAADYSIFFRKEVDKLNLSTHH